MNLFRTTPDGSLDKQYLRICAVGRLIDRGLLGKDRAVELLEQRSVKNARATVEIWLARASKRTAADDQDDFESGNAAWAASFVA